MESSANPEKQTTSPTQFSPTPTQPSPNTTIPSQPPPQSTQPATTQLPPMPPPPFSNLDNLPPFSTHSTSLQYPSFNQTSNAQHSSPYVRIVPDEHIIPPNQSQPVNSSTMLPIPNQSSYYQPSQQQHFSVRTSMFKQGDGSGEFEEDMMSMRVMWEIIALGRW
ncbi:proline-rich extensin-like protein EPR1 [Helianthus annuus]|uniref:proline-rich extensin-like protein EPR1 n=1 Tax=Helianthus annuus TaxID=4232 RepID=UPI000B8FB9A4|nr:proline-rich extensin-like protein EPR1 [Helianthus annuus]